MKTLAMYIEDIAVLDNQIGELDTAMDILKDDEDYAFKLLKEKKAQLEQEKEDLLKLPLYTEQDIQNEKYYSSPSGR